MKLRLQAKYTLAITLIILAVSLVVVATLHSQFHRTAQGMTETGLAVLDESLIRELKSDGVELARVLAEGLARPLATGDRAQAADLLDSLLSGEETLRYALVTDRDGRPMARFGGKGEPAPAAPSALQVERDGDTLLITRPVTFRDRPVGTVRLGITLDLVKARHEEMASALAAAQAARQSEEVFQLAGIFALLLLVGLLLGAVTARRLARPVGVLARQARALTAGELDRPLPPVRGHDEIAELAGAFEQMRSSLAGTTVSRDFLHRIIDSLREGLVVTSAGGEIRLVNRAAAETFGRPAGELAGHRFSALVADPERFAEAEPLVVESALMHPARGRVAVEISHVRLGTGPDAERVYVISEITARKALEEELWVYRSRLEHLVVERTKELTAAIHELETFSYSVSHDLHAPLRAINGFGAALLEEYYDLLDGPGRDYLDRINGATVRMGELIDGLLTLSRVARREIHREPVDLSALASAQAAELSATDPRRQVTFRIAPGLTVLADRALMRLLLQNLFGNAWKFTRDQRSARIELGQSEQEGTAVYFVRDNGAGFDPTAAQGLFQPFHRMHTNKEFPGTGIGLATVQRIVLRHGGEIWAEAAPGVGATFFFTLPAQVEESLVSSRAPLSNSVSSQRASATA